MPLKRREDTSVAWDKQHIKRPVLLLAEKLKETRIDTFERQAATFVELPVTKEVPASTELTVTHTICENKNDGCSFKDNTIAAVIKTNGVTFEITNTATSDFIKIL